MLIFSRQWPVALLLVDMNQKRLSSYRAMGPNGVSLMRMLAEYMDLVLAHSHSERLLRQLTQRSLDIYKLANFLQSQTPKHTVVVFTPLHRPTKLYTTDLTIFHTNTLSFGSP